MGVDSCCWIEIRLGTIILTVISVFISIFFATAFLGKPDVVSYGLSRGLTVFFGLLFILMALASIFGIIGALFKSAGGIKVFLNILRGIIIIYIAITILVIINMIRTKQEEIDLCMKEDSSYNQLRSAKSVTEGNPDYSTTSHNDTKAADCKHRVEVIIWIKSVVLILSTLFMVFLTGVTSKCSENLRIILKKVRIDSRTQKPRTLL